jgi:hypothetical protein
MSKAAETWRVLEVTSAWGSEQGLLASRLPLVIVDTTRSNN